MNLIALKICLIGDFGVGKTSLVTRFVKQTFSEKYLTTVGVKVDTKLVTVPRRGRIKFVIWDLAGTDTATSTFTSYLRGAAGYLLVADGTRAYTLESALELKASADALLGAVPFVGLLNKADLDDRWELDAQAIEALRAKPQIWLKTSAKTGTHVEESFIRLAEALIFP